jgi:hypothetical protein
MEPKDDDVKDVTPQVISNQQGEDNAQAEMWFASPSAPAHNWLKLNNSAFILIYYIEHSLKIKKKKKKKITQKKNILKLY